MLSDGPTGKEAPSLRLERLQAVAVITLDRPTAGNSINVAMADALLAAALECEADKSIRCVVLTGAGSMFCAGGDVKAFAEAGDDVAALIDRLTAPLHMAITRLSRMSKPLVTAVNGSAAGAGLGLAMLGDVALAAHSATFSVAYGGLGLSPDSGATWLLPRLVGLRQAQRLALTGERIGAPEAERIGLVTRSIDKDTLMNEAMLIASKLAGNSANAIRRTRALLHSSFSNSLEGQLEREAESISQAARDPDWQEGIAAFIAKRPPKFHG